jgi:osmotically-inducible protein OsmY
MSQDLRLREDVERELEWEPMVHSSEIGVGVKDGIVTLMGTIGSYSAKRVAERAAARVRGVKAVSSQLEVQSLAVGRNDADVWGAANVLSWNVLLPAERIRVEVSGGWVTLEGSVDWRFQRTAAEDCVRTLAGVRGITNLVSVNPSSPAEEIKQHIESALKRSQGLDATRIIVEADSDRVTLWGCVGSPSHREFADQTAWATPGVSEVSNHITVESAVAAGSKVPAVPGTKQ